MTRTREAFEVRSDDGLEGVFPDHGSAQQFVDGIRSIGARMIRIVPVQMPVQVRFAITHVCAASGMRRLTFGKLERDTFESRAEADEFLSALRVQSDDGGGLSSVLSTSELASLKVSAVDCYEHGDPISYHVDHVD